jgi:oxygen-dependent protoporphyrinogen oxidase
MQPRIAIVGGGISGLAVAHALRTTHAALGAELVVFEATARLGGNVRTIHRGDFLIDEGPDSWVAAKPEMTALARALGLGDRLIETTEENRRVYVRHRGSLVPLPEGLVLGIPTEILPLVRTPLISMRGKLRAALDLVLPVGFGRAAGEDEALGAFVERRLGREVLDGLAGPLLGGLFTGDAGDLSLLGTFPQLARLEARGGLIRGSLAMRPKRARGAPKPSAFTSLRGGVGEIVDALAARLGDAIRLETAVQRLARTGDGAWEITHDGGARIVDHVVLTGPAHGAARLLRGVATAAEGELDAIPYGSAATVFLSYGRTSIAHRLDATGYLVPRAAAGTPTASTWVSSKWEGRAPAGEVLLRVFFGGADVDRTDDDLVRRATEEIASTLRPSAPPRFTHVARFRRGSPQPRVGHPARLRRIAESLRATPGVHLVGSAYDGVGLSDCVRQAQAVARQIAEGPHPLR